MRQRDANYIRVLEEKYEELRQELKQDTEQYNKLVREANELSDRYEALKSEKKGLSQKVKNRLLKENKLLEEKYRGYKKVALDLDEMRINQQRLYEKKLADQREAHKKQMEMEKAAHQKAMEEEKAAIAEQIEKANMETLKHYEKCLEYAKNFDKQYNELKAMAVTEINKAKTDAQKLLSSKVCCQSLQGQQRDTCVGLKSKELGPLNLQDLIEKGDIKFDHSHSIELDGG